MDLLHYMNEYFIVFLCQVDGILNMYNVPAHRGIEIEGGDEAWDTEREIEKRKRQNTITIRFFTAIRSLARLRTPKPQAHTRIEIEEEKSKCH